MAFGTRSPQLTNRFPRILFSTIHLPLAALGAVSVTIVACSSPKPAFCGDSFCITQMPIAVEKEKKVDFNVYRIRTNKKEFVIFEGSNPNLSTATNIGDIGKVPSGFAEGTLFRSEDGYTVLLRTTNPNPDVYVAASIPSNDVDALKEFVKTLRAR